MKPELEEGKNAGYGCILDCRNFSEYLAEVEAKVLLKIGE